MGRIQARRDKERVRNIERYREVVANLSYTGRQFSDPELEIDIGSVPLCISRRGGQEDCGGDH